jgi:hypothetical protein
MYHFAVVALLGLAVLKVTDLLGELVPALARVRTLLTFVLAVAAVVAIDYSIFNGFGIDVRENWMGIWATGFMVGSLTTVWRAGLRYLGLTEEPASEERTHRPRVAA